MHLTGTELLDWIGLRRVREGGVALYDSGYVQWGRKVPCYLPEIFDRLISAELIELLDSACSREPRRVVLTSCGRDRYQELTAKRGFPVDPEQSSGDCSVPPGWPLSPIAAGQGSGVNIQPVRGECQDHALTRRYVTGSHLVCHHPPPPA